MVKKYEISPIYDSNESFQLTDWTPPLDPDYTNIKTNSWFDIKFYENPNKEPVIEHIVPAPQIPIESYNQQMKTIQRWKLDKDPVFLCSKKIRLYPTNDQKIILDEWFDASNKMYNITIEYIRFCVFEDGKLIKNAKELSFTYFRNILLNDKRNIIASMNSPIYTHVMDETIALAVSNYNACLTNYRNGNISKFRIREWSRNKRRHVIKIESELFSDDSFCTQIFGTMESSEPLTDIKHTSTLQFNRDTGKYILLVPHSIEQKLHTINDLDCGADLGVRTFVTIYSKNNTVSIGNDLYKKVKVYHKKIDKINELLMVKPEDRETSVTKNKIVNGIRIKEVVRKPIKRSRLIRARRKYYGKITDMVRDMHFKVAHYLVTNYGGIYIGKLSTLKILSKNNHTISRATKRMVGVLAPSKFRRTLDYMSHKYGKRISHEKEYYTTKTCSNCGRINNLGKSKIHECACGMNTGRDENAAKNMLKVGYAREDAEGDSSESSLIEINPKMFVINGEIIDY